METRSALLVVFTESSQCFSKVGFKCQGLNSDSAFTIGFICFCVCEGKLYQARGTWALTYLIRVSQRVGVHWQFDKHLIKGARLKWKVRPALVVLSHLRCRSFEEAQVQLKLFNFPPRIQTFYPQKSMLTTLSPPELASEHYHSNPQTFHPAYTFHPANALHSAISP